MKNMSVEERILKTKRMNPFASMVCISSFLFSDLINMNKSFQRFCKLSFASIARYNSCCVFDSRDKLIFHQDFEDFDF